MKFTMNRAVFINELSVVQRAIPSKSTIPILSGLKMVLSDEGLALTGSNGDISIETFLSSQNEKAEMTIESTGSIVLQAKFFGEIVRKLPDNHFSFEVLDNLQVKINSGTAEFVVNGLSSDNYPHLPIIEEQNQLKLPARVLNKIINETVFSVSLHESRPILTGVHFTLDTGVLTAVATDSHRLSQRQIMMPSTTESFDIVVPGKSLTELSKSFADEEEMVEINIMENQVLFRTENMNFYSRLLEGKYPDTKRLIPTSFETEVEFNVPSLMAAIDRASLLSHEGRNNIVKLSIEADKVTIYGNSPEIGNVQEDLTFNKISGQPLDISFNPDYMKAALKAFGAIDINIRFISPIRPFTLEPTDSEISFVQLITPVRTS
ncbi:DNA polymerase III subunit beta [Vagococcus xieshaowenii]|uniref:Beta sliding clamp n=1 Tax=Vagococcus xieshaowenii TaxID=2562451 RepID=A0A4Z0DC96_9ENTE|nr:DNA polymerase III subunit beta [Vagococcus xieshaowenii]QCA29552.1 DNA polymerase III subunit beta [Vagococcus xieshaowenii]TFZ42445.1 DNA polymerase III subunit beta [Vagococcus xieshaowenii]